MRQLGLGGCPACGAPLREVLDRLVCTRCDGLLIPRSSLAAAFARPLAVVDDGQSQRRCPRCDDRLASCLLEVGQGDDLLQLPQACWICPEHGVWLDAGVLEAMLLHFS